MVSLGSSLVNLLTIGASGEAVVANGSPYEVVITGLMSTHSQITSWSSSIHF